ncbi:MAG: hypothetical protein Q8O25_16865 [Sulfurisoma sp.]|nr:hypothetical protein [Sulfurisoma sp.]
MAILDLDFTLDRFHALLARMPPPLARVVADSLGDPDDLLFVLDAVHFGREDGALYFADYVAADWTTRASDWSMADRRLRPPRCRACGERRRHPRHRQRGSL